VTFVKGRSAVRGVVAVCAAVTLVAPVGAVGSAFAVEAPEWSEVCRFSDARLTEISGMAPSLVHDDLLWIHNDSSDAAVLYGVDSTTCDTVAELRLRGVDARDFEGMASSRSAKGRSRLWVGDIGDNRDSWQYVTIHRVREPSKLGKTSRKPRSWRFTYPDRPHNAETLMVNGRDVWTATWQLANGGLYSVPLASDVGVATRIGDVGSLVTDGAMSPDARSYVLRDYLDLQVFSGLPPGRRVAKLALPIQAQGEAIAWASDGQSLFTASEGDDRLLRFDLPWWVLASLRPPDHLVS